VQYHSQHLNRGSHTHRPDSLVTAETAGRLDSLVTAETAGRLDSLITAETAGRLDSLVTAETAGQNFDQCFSIHRYVSKVKGMSE